MSTRCEWGAGTGCGELADLVVTVEGTGQERQLCAPDAGRAMLAAAGADPTVVHVTRIQKGHRRVSPFPRQRPTEG